MSKQINSKLLIWPKNTNTHTLTHVSVYFSTSAARRITANNKSRFDNKTFAVCHDILRSFTCSALSSCLILLCKRSLFSVFFYALLILHRILVVVFFYSFQLVCSLFISCPILGLIYFMWPLTFTPLAALFPTSRFCICALCHKSYFYLWHCTRFTLRYAIRIFSHWVIHFRLFCFDFFCYCC